MEKQPKYLVVSALLKGVRVEMKELGVGGLVGRSKSYPSRGQSLAIRVGAHGQ